MYICIEYIYTVCTRNPRHVSRTPFCLQCPTLPPARLRPQTRDTGALAPKAMHLLCLTSGKVEVYYFKDFFYRRTVTNACHSMASSTPTCLSTCARRTCVSKVTEAALTLPAWASSECTTLTSLCTHDSSTTSPAPLPTNIWLVSGT